MKEENYAAASDGDDDDENDNQTNGIEEKGTKGRRDIHMRKNNEKKSVLEKRRDKKRARVNHRLTLRRHWQSAGL